MKLPLVALCLALAAGACTTTPGATQLDELELGEGEPPIDLVAARGPAEELPVLPLDEEGVRGGRAAFAVEGDVEAVLAALLDFDAAAGHRAWAKEYATLEREDDVVRAEWRFRGRMGLNPTVVLELTVERGADETTVEYHVVEPAFGMAAFFGDYRLRPLEEGLTLLIERVFIDSGVVFANASAEDIEKGLREDARLLREWMVERSTSE